MNTGQSGSVLHARLHMMSRDIHVLARVPNRFFGIRDFSGKDVGTGQGISRFYEAGCGLCYFNETTITQDVY